MPVVDASVAIDWVAPGVDPSLPSIAVLDRPADQGDDQGDDLIAPRLFAEEVANALLTGIRRGRWSGTAADEGWALFRRLPVRFIDDERDLERAWDLARRYDAHPVYGMLYVALAERRRTQLITADEALRRRLRGLDWIVSPEAFVAGRR